MREGGERGLDNAGRSLAGRFGGRLGRGLFCPSLARPARRNAWFTLFRRCFFRSPPTAPWARTQRHDSPDPGRYHHGMAEWKESRRSAIHPEQNVSNIRRPSGETETAADLAWGAASHPPFALSGGGSRLRQLLPGGFAD